MHPVPGNTDHLKQRMPSKRRSQNENSEVTPHYQMTETNKTYLYSYIFCFTASSNPLKCLQQLGSKYPIFPFP